MSSKTDAKLSLFAHEYVIDLNATRAATEAGYSEKSAHVTGCRLLRNAKVQQEISRLIAARKDHSSAQAFETMQRLIELAILSPEQTKGSIMGQVKACQVIAQIRGEIIQRHEDVTERLRGKTAEELDFIGCHRRDPKDAEELRLFTQARKLGTQ